jgi:hypothetical protein
MFSLVGLSCKAERVETSPQNAGLQEAGNSHRRAIYLYTGVALAFLNTTALPLHTSFMSLHSS